MAGQRDAGAGADVSTTMIYTHVLNKGGKGVKSPLDLLCGGGSSPCDHDNICKMSAAGHPATKMKAD